MPVTPDLSIGEGKKGSSVSGTDSYRADYKSGLDTLLIGVQVSIDLNGALTLAQLAGFGRVAVHAGPAKAGDGANFGAGNNGNAQGGTGTVLADHCIGFPAYGGGPHMIWLFRPMKAGDVVSVECGGVSLGGETGVAGLPYNISFVALPMNLFAMPGSFPTIR